MNPLKALLRSIPPVRYYAKGRRVLSDPIHREGLESSLAEVRKTPSRTAVLNFLLSKCEGSTRYLEIGVRNPDDNFNHIVADQKYSVDPGVEFEQNPVDFPLTSDEFFERLDAGEVLSPDVSFDVIFVDGLHLADQADRDIANALRFVAPRGFVVMHDCNPPTEWHAREERTFYHTPASGDWNGTTWKAFVKWRMDAAVHSCCVDTDWGVGILSKEQAIGAATSQQNPFFEYHTFARHRKEFLNLISFEKLESRVAAY